LAFVREVQEIGEKIEEVEEGEVEGRTRKINHQTRIPESMAEKIQRCIKTLSGQVHLIL